MKPSRSATLVRVPLAYMSKWKEQLKDGSSATFESLLSEFFSIENGREQVSWLLKVRNRFEGGSGDIALVALILSDLYCLCTSRHPCRRAIASLFDHFYQNGKGDAIVSELSRAVRERLHEVIPFESSLPDDVDHAMDCVVSLSENFTAGCDCLHQLSSEILSAVGSLLPSQAAFARQQIVVAVQAKAMNSCIITIKAITTTLQRTCQHESCVVVDQCSLNDCEKVLKLILADDTFTKDCQSSASLGLIWILRVKVKSEHLLSSEINSLLDGSWFDGLCDFSKAVLFSALLVIIPAGSFFLKDGESDCILTESMLPKLIQLSQRCSEPGLRLAQARCLAEWTSVAKSCLGSAIPESGRLVVAHCLNVRGSVVNQLFDYVWTHWDDSIEGIRIFTSLLFINVCQIEKILLPKDEHDVFLVEILKKIVSVDLYIRGKYKPLEHLVVELGVLNVLELEPFLPTKLISVMGDQNMASHAKELVKKMLDFHWIALEDSDKVKWEEAWINPLLTFLCTAGNMQRQYATEFCLPFIFDVNPQALARMLDNLEKRRLFKSETILPAYISVLKVAKARGTLQKRNHEGSSTLLWNGVIEIATLKSALCHANEQIRRDAFDLICSSHKTIEIVADVDLELIQTCLPWYLSSQSAAFRPVVLGGVKRILRRIRDSSYSIIKRCHTEKVGHEENKTLLTYGTFLSWYIETLFDGIHPAACFQRATMTLRLLSLLWEIFPSSSSEGTLFSTENALNWRQMHALIAGLEDAFEANRQHIIGILAKIPSEQMPLRESNYVALLTKRAFHLVSSPRTVDCLAGSSYFRLLAMKCVREQAMRLPMAIDSSPHEIACEVECHLLAFLTDLLALIRRQAEANKANFFTSVPDHSMYGLMQALRSVLTDTDIRSLSDSREWVSFFGHLLDVYLDVAGIVTPVIAHSSPESSQLVEDEGSGVYSEFIVPMDVVALDLSDAQEPSRSGFAPTAQLVLVCSWRSMKEVCLMLGDLVQRLATAGLTIKQVKRVGEFFTKLLTIAKHVGAFEMAYAGFYKHCWTLWRSSVKELQDTPGRWTEEVLVMLSNATLSESLIFTRRSAGLPFFVQALLATEPDTAGRPHLKSVMAGLLDISEMTNVPEEDLSEKSLTLPQVHALNILRDLYKDSRLGEHVVSFIARGISTAVQGFSSNSWAVRNSSTLLYSSLISRVFGVPRSKLETSKHNCLTGREFFAKFPSLHKFLVNELEKATEKLSKIHSICLHASLYPVLLLLSRLYPSVMEGTKSTYTLSAFLPYIMKCRSSAIIKARIMAADALPPLVSLAELPSILEQLLHDIPSYDHEKDGQVPKIASQNHLHGTLLQVKSLLERRGVFEPLSSLDVQKVLISIPSRLWIASRLNPCPLTRQSCLTAVRGCILSPPVELSPEFSPVLENIRQILIKTAEDTLGDVSLPVEPVGHSGYLTALTDTYLSLVERKSSQSLALTLFSKEDRNVKLSVSSFIEKSLRCDHWLDGLDSLLKTLSDVVELSGGDDPALMVQVFKAINTAVSRAKKPSTEFRTAARKILDCSVKIAKEFWNNPSLGYWALYLSSNIVSSIYDKDWPTCLGRSVLKDVTELIIQFSSEEMVEELRMAAASCLSKVAPFSLLLAHDYPVDLSLCLWEACLLLLQDEEKAVRQTVASCVVSLQPRRHQEESPPVLSVRCFELIPPILLSVFSPSWSLQLWDSLMHWMHPNQSPFESVQEMEGKEVLFIKGEINPYYETTQMIDVCVSTLKMLAPLVAVNGESSQQLRTVELAKTITAAVVDGGPFPCRRLDWRQIQFLDLYRVVKTAACFSVEVNGEMHLDALGVPDAKTYFFCPAVRFSTPEFNISSLNLSRIEGEEEEEE
eukprot:m.17973 g.17973  ORF g.17973 m.17973 type:complete len:1862 (+) comp27575_c0_seq3:14-5599(+)